MPLVALGAALATAGPASAAQLSGGSTTLRLDSGTAKALSGAGVSVAPVKPAKAGRSGVAFPITGGKANPATLAGTINHSGGLRLRAGGTSVRLTSFRVKVGKRSSLSALLGGKRVTILSLSRTKAKVRRTGFDTTVSGVKASLNSTAAKALNQAFDTSLFKRGLTLGTATVAAKFAQADLIERGATTLAPDPGTVAALASLGVTPSAIAPATAGSGGLSFPILGGTSLNLKTLAGHVRHSGGIALTKGSTRVELKNFLIRIDSKPRPAGRAGRQAHGDRRTSMSRASRRP